ncbi:hypothetical protein [Umezawaea tangerina]|uniref:SH3 domain-containing protein n=1 Tax=Umezawaea tangerina TaxID=84725 RepID=A0A2T0T807_9PSEU|nr:hypothetical protein [Umezawaea tangerina]PRY41787.1 hypothetical protein CLV43_105546 [Umezawaea tangerina]
MRIANAAAVAVLATGALLGGVAPAGADPAAQAKTFYRVTAWHDVNIRLCPASSCTLAGLMVAGTSSDRALCWTHGEEITDAGITNDIWIVVREEDGGPKWASAVYFTGDERAGIPVEAACAY